MSFFEAWGACLAGGFLLWLFSLWRRDASIVDIWWSLGFTGLALAYRAWGPPAEPWQIAHLAMVVVWGLRLSLHIAWRGRGQGEDPRYGAMRRAHGARFVWVSLLTVFWLQATLVALLVTPLRVVQEAEQLRWPGVFWVGALLWAVGFFFEAVGDWQLLRFKADEANRGRVLDRGLWRFTRHPNYFGEALLWWGFGLAAVAVGGAWTLYSPLAMTFLLLRVSGVTLLEKTIGDRRPAYADYVRRTNAFLPWFPKDRAG